jgi:hypothetical protein
MVLGVLGGQCGAAESGKDDAAVVGKIGVYDSRAIAIASVGGKAFRDRLQKMRADFEKAKSQGDQKRMDALKAAGVEVKKRLHMQGFSTAPVDDLLETVRDRLPEVRKKTGVDKLVSKWDKKTLEQYKTAKQIDVTAELVDLFGPTEAQKKMLIEIQKRPPIPLEQAEKMRD